MSSTEARRRLVARLVATETIESQAQLRRLLSHAGHAVTQATISRDLEAIGATKAREGDVSRYRIRDLGEMRRARAALAAATDEFVEAVAVTGPLVVVRVAPGAANVLASRIDAAGLTGVLGTVAGDDTILVAIDQATDAAEVAAIIEGE